MRLFFNIIWYSLATLIFSFAAFSVSAGGGFSRILLVSIAIWIARARYNSVEKAKKREFEKFNRRKRNEVRKKILSGLKNTDTYK